MPAFAGMTSYFFCGSGESRNPQLIMHAAFVGMAIETFYPEATVKKNFVLLLTLAKTRVVFAVNRAFKQLGVLQEF